MEEKKNFNEIMQEFADEIRQEAQESLKVKLALFLKTKYDITLSDDDWQLIFDDCE